MFTYLRSAYTGGEKNQQSVRLLFCLTGSQKTINNQKNRSRQTDRQRERRRREQGVCWVFSGSCRNTDWRPCILTGYSDCLTSLWATFACFIDVTPVSKLSSVITESLLSLWRTVPTTDPLLCRTTVVVVLQRRWGRCWDVVPPSVLFVVLFSVFVLLLSMVQHSNRCPPCGQVVKICIAAT